MNLSGNTILITGGGSGIGRELAQRFHALGNTVIVAGRTPASLEGTVRGYAGMHARTVDMSDAASIAAFAAALVKDFPALNVVINNAGIMQAENLLAGAIDIGIAEATIATNLLGPIRLTSALLPHLRAQAAAAVINVTSGLAFVPLPRTPAYNATKAALHSWTVALRALLSETPVEVIEIIPPAVQTELTPGQSTRAHYMPLTDYINETLDLFAITPTPQEICVENVKPLRNAEAEGRFAEMLGMLKQLG